MDEIVVTEKADVEPMGTELGVKTIEQEKTITIPDVLRNEPDIDIQRRALIGNTADNLVIRGFSANRILLNINGRPDNASGVVGGYYIDWGTIPLDNIEKNRDHKGGQLGSVWQQRIGWCCQCDYQKADCLNSIQT